MPRCAEAKSITDLDARQSSSLQGRELERGVESNKADLEAKSVSETAGQLRSEADKRNILISPLEGEKKFLSELCELRNFREGYKKPKNTDRATQNFNLTINDLFSFSVRNDMFFYSTNTCHRGLCSAICLILNKLSPKYMIF